MKLKDKVTLVTGASSGIGYYIAKAFASEGSNLILTARRKSKIDELAKELSEKYGVKVLTIENDIRDNEKVSQFINSLSDEWKDIDILINNAGLALGLSTIQEGDIQDWEDMIDTNVKGLLYISRLILPRMVEREKGMVINISSIAGITAYPKGNVYCATKSAVTTISQAMAIDLNGTGIRVCNIEPGLVETEFSKVRFHGNTERAAMSYQNIDALQGEDIAEIALFAATRPPHVMIQNIMVTPTAQANVSVVSKK